MLDIFQKASLDDWGDISPDTIQANLDALLEEERLRGVTITSKMDVIAAKAAEISHTLMLCQNLVEAKEKISAIEENDPFILDKSRLIYAEATNGFTDVVSVDAGYLDSLDHKSYPKVIDAMYSVTASDEEVKKVKSLWDDIKDFAKEIFTEKGRMEKTLRNLKQDYKKAVNKGWVKPTEIHLDSFVFSHKTLEEKEWLAIDLVFNAIADYAHFLTSINGNTTVSMYMTGIGNITDDMHNSKLWSNVPNSKSTKVGFGNKTDKIAVMSKFGLCDVYVAPEGMLPNNTATVQKQPVIVVEPERNELPPKCVASIPFNSMDKALEGLEGCIEHIISAKDFMDSLADVEVDPVVWDNERLYYLIMAAAVRTSIAGPELISAMRKAYIANVTLLTEAIRQGLVK